MFIYDFFFPFLFSSSRYTYIFSIFRWFPSSRVAHSRRYIRKDIIFSRSLMPILFYRLLHSGRILKPMSVRAHCLVKPSQNAREYVLYWKCHRIECTLSIRKALNSFWCCVALALCTQILHVAWTLTIATTNTIRTICLKIRANKTTTIPNPTDDLTRVIIAPGLDHHFLEMIPNKNGLNTFR